MPKKTSTKPRFLVVTGDIGECLVCGKIPTVIGLHKPEFPAEFGIRKGQAIAYQLCDACWEDGRIDKVEAILYMGSP